jgi:hypothetical protein
MSTTTYSRNTGLEGLAMTIARRLQAMRGIAAEKGELPRPGDLAHQFRVMVERSTLHGGPISTSEMAALASDLIPDATARLELAA